MVILLLNLFFVNESLAIQPMVQKPQAFYLADSLGEPVNTRVVAPQLQQSAEFNLGGHENLIGLSGLSARQVLQQLGAGYEICTPKLLRYQLARANRVVHEYYEIHCHGIPIFPGELTLHHHNNQLTMVRTNLPESLFTSHIEDQAFESLDSLGMMVDTLTIHHQQKIWFSEVDQLTPAWRLEATLESAPGLRLSHELVVHAQSGAILSTRPIDFSLAKVYESNPKSGKLIDVELANLLGNGFLDGKNFAIFAPGDHDPRVYAQNQTYIYSPDLGEHTKQFDQVQSYYSAENTLSWFAERFGYQLTDKIKVRVHATPEGFADNALYKPVGPHPEIQIGKGGQTLFALARDQDVIAHEMSHHVLYQRLKSTSGETGILHEGTADYFAYARAGDPFLAESIVKNAPYLRTAKIPADWRQDDPSLPKSKHFRGQIWSALLWHLREALGDKMDTLVFDSIAYLGHTSGFQDAILGLLNADRDHFPLAADDPEFNTYGQNKCAILNATTRFGYGAFTRNFAGTSCGLDLQKIAEESRAFSESKRKAQAGKDISFKFMGKKCSVVAGPTHTHQGWLNLWLLLLPVVTLLITRNKRIPAPIPVRTLIRPTTKRGRTHGP